MCKKLVKEAFPWRGKYISQVQNTYSISRAYQCNEIGVAVF